MKKIIYTALIASVAFASCSKFDEYNTNPDSTTDATAAMLATGVELSSFKSGGDAKAYISYSALPKYVAYLTEGAMDTQYNKIGRCGFDSYALWPNYDKMIEYAQGTEFESSYRGLAGFLKAYNAYNLTMRTGDIPYSEAGQGKEGNVTPKYDTQEEVFKSILAELETAETNFASGRDFSGDIIYSGSVAKWRKATNVLRLKVLLSLSKKISAEQKAEFDAIVKAGNLIESNDDNLQLVYTTTSGTWHPLYNQTLFNPYTTVSELVVDELKRLSDRRLFYFAEPASAQLAAGKSKNEFDAYVGTNTAADFTKSAAEFQNGKFSPINKRYISEQAGDPYLHLSYAEQCLIIAEGIELGWTSGDAKTYYENGVKAALSLVASYDPDGKYNHDMSIDDAYIASYFNGPAAYAATKEERVKQIWMQKYLLKFLQDGYDAYMEVRRTGYPVFPNDPNTSLNIDNKEGFPTRWQYPEGETKTNFENLDAALKRQFKNGYDGTNESMWLLK